VEIMLGELPRARGTLIDVVDTINLVPSSKHLMDFPSTPNIAPLAAYGKSNVPDQ